MRMQHYFSAADFNPSNNNTYDQRRVGLSTMMKRATQASEFSGGLSDQIILKTASGNICVFRWPQFFLPTSHFYPTTTQVFFGGKVFSHFSCDVPGLPHPQRKTPSSILMMGRLLDKMPKSCVPRLYFSSFFTLRIYLSNNTPKGTMAVTTARMLLYGCCCALLLCTMCLRGAWLL